MPGMTHQYVCTAGSRFAGTSMRVLHKASECTAEGRSPKAAEGAADAEAGLSCCADRQGPPGGGATLWIHRACASCQSALHVLQPLAHLQAALQCQRVAARCWLSCQRHSPHSAATLAHMHRPLKVYIGALVCSVNASTGPEQFPSEHWALHTRRSCLVSSRGFTCIRLSLDEPGSVSSGVTLMSAVKPDPSRLNAPQRHR